MIFYHVTAGLLAEGSVIEPGNWGRIVRAFGYRHIQWNRELALEQARQAHRPDAPSRFECFFGCPSESDARAYRFRDPALQVSLVYEVEPVQDHLPIFLAPLDVLERWDPADMQRPLRYWREGHRPGETPVTPNNYVGVAAVTYEVLLGGAARVRRRLAD